MIRFFFILLTLTITAPTLADDWVVMRARGDVEQRISSGWVDLERGDIVPDSRLLRTGPDGRLSLKRDQETIDLEGNTQIRIEDSADRMTTVLQDFGVVAIEAERRNVQHFSVQTPFLAAVVKGTRFTVTLDAAGASVAVERGVVQIQDSVNDLVADIRPGQQASVARGSALAVSDPAVKIFNIVDGEIGARYVAPPDNTDNGNAGGNGKSNAGGNGNSNAGGNGNSNAGGNGKSNAGGIGNSNAGGNGNSNAGGNSNGNAGGNGNSNSNAGGNGKSNAGGNGNGSGKDDE